MRVAVLIVGLIAGVIGLIIGLGGYGIVAALGAENNANVVIYKVLAIGAPVVTLIGSGLALSRLAAAGILLVLGAAGMFDAFGLGQWSAIPIVLAAVGAVFAFMGLGRRRR